ncbi:MAG: hypothetical protein ACYCYO_09910, partial [Bacilli bacterium]
RYPPNAAVLDIGVGTGAFADRWDPDEEYALVGSLDDMLYTALFRSVRWMQTAPLHFACTATK